MALRLSTALRNALLGLSEGTDGCLKDLMQDGIIDIYSGSQPASADAAETGTLLVRITVASGAFTSGVATNGIELGGAASGVIAKNSDVWSGVALAAGTAGWFRWYANTVVTGLVTTTGLRLDGTCGTSAAQLILSNVSIVTGATVTIDTFSITLPANA